jgi:hypothetical protein
MKKIFLLLAVLFCSFTLSSVAKADVVLNSTNFPDSAFRKFLVNKTGVQVNQTLTDAKIATIDTLVIDAIEETDTIKSVKGLEYFIATKYLTLDIIRGWLAVDSLDLRNNVALVNANVRSANHHIKYLNLSGLLNLKRIKFYGLDSLKSIDLSNCSALTNIYGYSDVPFEINITNDSKIDTLDLTNISKNTTLLMNPSDFQSLKYLEVNNIDTLDLSQATNLETLSCWWSMMTALDVSACKKLTYIDLMYCSNLRSLDVTNNTVLTYLDLAYCDRIGPTIDLSKNKLLTTLNLQYVGEDVYDKYGNKIYKHPDLTQNTKLTSLIIGRVGGETIDLSKNTELKSLTCGGSIKYLDLSNNTKLINLGISGTSIASIDLSKNTALKYLFGYDSDYHSYLGKQIKRNIKVYSYKRSAAKGGGVGYYVPLEDQYDSNGNLVAKKLSTLIHDAGYEEEPELDMSRTSQWGDYYGFFHEFRAVEEGTYNGTPVYYLKVDTVVTNYLINKDTSIVVRPLTYQYNTNFPGSITQSYFLSKTFWIDYSIYEQSSSACPNITITLTWDTISGQGVITGVEDVKSGNINIYGTTGYINIGGSFTGYVNVYSLGGQQMYRGKETSIPVPAGLYVVKVDGTVKKVIVR